MKLLLAFALVLSVAGCKKKEADPNAAPPAAPAPAAPVGSAAPSASDAGSIAAETPDAATGAATGSSTGSAGSAGSADGSATGNADCATYAKVAAACGHGADAAKLQSQCENSLAKNNALASSVRVW